MLIATYSRPAELAIVLQAVSQSACPVDQVVVVDASPPNIQRQVEMVCADFRTLPLKYIPSPVASLCHQRNLGKKFLLETDVDYIQVLDDDTSPHAEYIGTLVKLLDTDSDIVGVAGITETQILNPSALQVLKKVIFWAIGLEAFKPGVVSRAGCGIAPNPNRTGQTEWLFGCSMWRRSVLENQDYLDELPGSSLFEDTEFSLRASRMGKLLVTPEALLLHTLSPVERPNLELYSYRFSRNRWFVIKAMEDPKAQIWYWLSVLFLSSMFTLKSLLSLGKTESSEYRRASLATMKGAVHAFQGKPPL